VEAPVGDRGDVPSGVIGSSVFLACRTLALYIGHKGEAKSVRYMDAHDAAGVGFGNGSDAIRMENDKGLNELVV
jgi:hypothetical protein